MSDPITSVAEGVANGASLIQSIARGLGLEARAIKLEGRAKVNAYLELIDAKIEGADRIAKAKNRVISTILLEEENLEHILHMAAAELPNYSETIQIEQGWALSYQKAAVDISDPELQKIWGKLLAGEIRKQGTFSLKTIEILKSMGTKDVLCFEKMCSHVLDLIYVTSDSTKQHFMDNLPITHNETLALQWYGLLLNVPTYGFKNITSILVPLSPDSTFDYHGMQIGIMSEKNSITLNGYVLSPAGLELKRLVSIKPDFEFLNNVARGYLCGQSYKFCIVDKIENNQIIESRPLPINE